MVDFYKKVTEDQGAVEDLVRRLPGFGGYFERQDRRAADRLLREHLVTEFEELHNDFTRMQRELVDSGGIMHMEKVQHVDTKLSTFIDRIEAAAEGYASVFDAVKVDEAALARIYAFDYALLQYKDQFQQGLNVLESAIDSEDADVGNVLGQLEDVVDEANNAFKRRKEAIMGLEDIQE